MRLPEIGELNRRITLSKLNHEPIGASDITETKVPVGKLWAKFEPVGGVNYWNSVNLGETITHRVYIRRIEQKTTPQALGNLTEIECDGVAYAVRRVTDVNGQRRFTLIECCELGVNDGTTRENAEESAGTTVDGGNRGAVSLLRL